jgi:hypothetical protein
VSASQVALRGHIAQLEQDNVELRLALARTTKQLAETLEEYKLLRIPLRRLMKRRAAEQLRVVMTEPEPVERTADVVPLIVVPGR